MAASLIVDPTIATDMRKLNVVVDIAMDSTFGTTSVSPNGIEANVCFAIDTAKFYNSFINIIKDAK